jgi:hypothetical protein
MQEGLNTRIQCARRGRQTQAVAEFLGALDDEDPDADRKLPKVISPVDRC